MDFSPEEKAVVYQCISENPGLKHSLSYYWPYILPLIIVGCYGFFQQDYLIISIVFVLFLAQAFWFFMQTAKSGKHLRTALIKYESKVKALDQDG